MCAGVVCITSQRWARRGYHELKVVYRGGDAAAGVAECTIVERHVAQFGVCVLWTQWSRASRGDTAT